MEDFTRGTPREEERAATAWIAKRLQGPTVQARRPGAARAGWFAAWYKPALGVAVLLIVSGVALQMRPWERGTDVPGSFESGVVRSGSLTLEGPVGDIAAAPAELRWSAVAGAARYEVVLTEVDGEEVWRETATGTTLALGERARALFLPKKTLLWTVTAVAADGKKLAVSEAARVRVAR